MTELKYKSIRKLHQAFCNALSEISAKNKQIHDLTFERDSEQEEFEATIKSFGFLVVKQEK